MTAAPSSPSRLLRSMLPSFTSFRSGFSSDPCESSSASSSHESCLSGTTTSSGCTPEQCLDEDERRMDELIQNKLLRDDLIADLLARQSLDLVMTIRFVCAVNEFLRTQPQENKASKGMSIIKVFLESDSRFQVKDVPDHLVSALLVSGKNLETGLVQLKQYVLGQRLLKDEWIRSELSNRS